MTYGATTAGAQQGFTFAFQPIVDVRSQKVLSYEALVRGLKGEGAGLVLGSVASAELPGFDSECRQAAIGLATKLAISCDLNLNLVPQSFAGDHDYLADTVQTAERNNVALNRIVLEITENGVLGEHDFLDRINEYRGRGIKLALDDFGAGYSGLNLLAEFQPEQLKLDRNLVHGIATSGPRQAIVRAIVQVCRDLGIDLIAEGLETYDEFQWFCDENVHLFQGFFFARPGFESLPTPVFPAAYKPAYQSYPNLVQ